MRIFRICKANHAQTAFSGQGALRYAGRWHHAGTAVVYASESRALAALEQLVHLQRSRLPPHFVCIALEISDGIARRSIEFGELPPDWRRQPGPAALRDLGTRWFQSGDSVCLELPSAIVPREHNYLLNPQHSDFARLAISAPELFEFDERLLSLKSGSDALQS